MTLYKPALGNRIEDDIVGIAAALTELDPSVITEHNLNETSPANGYYVKFAMGLIVCWHAIVLVYHSASELRATWTFPHQFDNADTVSTFGSWESTRSNFTSATIDRLYGVRFGQPGQDDVAVRFENNTGKLIATHEAFVHAVAIGK